jgi:Tfp pilus assembly protein PilO
VTKSYAPLLGSILSVVGGLSLSLANIKDWAQAASAVVGVIAAVSFLVIQWRREMRHTKTFNNQQKQNEKLLQENLEMLRKSTRKHLDDHRDSDND